MNIEILFQEIHNSLPNIPQVALDLIQQFDDPDADIDSVAGNISLDPVLAARVLRLANSARFRGARPSTSVQDAALRVGFNTLRTLVLASALTGAFKADPSFNLRGFWMESFEVASVSRLLARYYGADAETAFTCGMLHNIGELLIQTGAPQYAALINQARIPAATRAATETRQLGFSYAEVGAELVRRWQLPTLIQQAIFYQARPMQAPEQAVLPIIMAQAILIADTFRSHEIPSEEARQVLDVLLTEGVETDRLFADLPAVLEADKVFMELIS